MGLLYSSRRILLGGQAAGPSWWDPNGEGLSVWCAYQPKGAASFAVSLIDLTGNGNNAGDPGGADTPPWDAVNGWKFDGVSDYLTTTFIPDRLQTQTILVQFTNAIAVNNDCMFGCLETPVVNGACKHLWWVGAFRYANTSAVTLAGSAFQAAGNVGVAGAFGYLDGVVDTGALGQCALPITLSVYIGAQNENGARTRPAAQHIQAFVIYDVTLTAPQILAIATAMAAL